MQAIGRGPFARSWQRDSLATRGRRIYDRFAADRRQAGLLRPPARINSPGVPTSGHYQQGNKSDHGVTAVAWGANIASNIGLLAA